MIGSSEERIESSLTIRIWSQNVLWYFGQRLKTVFPGGSDSKASPCNVEHLGSIPGLGRSPGEGNGNACEYSCLEKSMDRGA